MAEISSNGDKPPIILLKIEPSFIRGYKLEMELNNSSIYDSVFLSEDQKEAFNYPFLFPPDKSNYDSYFLETFLTLYNDLLTSFGLNEYGDHILFLTNIFSAKNLDTTKDLHKEQFLRQRGKMLYYFIKAPLPIYDLTNIVDAINDSEVEDFEKQDILATYLSVISGRPIDSFLRNGKLDKRKISRGLAIALIERILVDKNISVEMPNGRPLIISCAVELQFYYKSDSKKQQYFSTTDKDQEIDFVSVIVKQLFEEQRVHNTPFYKALLDFDFAFNRNYDALGKLVGDWKITGRSTYNLYQLYSKLNDYFSDYNLLELSSKTLTTRRRDKFIYQLFILMNLIGSNQKVVKGDIKRISTKLREFKAQQKETPTLATAKLHDSFKNLPY